MIPRRYAHFGTTNYTYIKWLGRQWHIRPLHMTMREWLGIP